ncbi:MAG: hypothetical protein EXX96DRAFT_31773 [Benjaminiella poitrasii]|nr:MAG: hypothetical protein EXX96DRAFT_31773 [Benjaminiella poitrasii]
MSKHRKAKKKPGNEKITEKTSPINRFRLSATSGHLLPLQTIRQRIVRFWESLTWPVCVKMLKANIAVTIALGLLLIDPIRQAASVGGILASVAVEFVHPTKSYGFLAEDVLVGAVMCCVSAAWSILAIYCAFLVRDQNDPTLAQRGECALLSCFLVVGCYFLTLFRAKVEQANVGGMLSGTIMVISITTAVTQTEFSATTTLQVLVPTLVGFLLIFIIFLLVFPENSTRVFIQHLIKSFETFDGITQRQVAAFLKVSKTDGPRADSLATIHQAVDSLTTTLIQRKRMVRREPSFNAISPTDVSEMTTIVKQLGVPLQGLGLSRAMEENMREAEKSVFRPSSSSDDNQSEASPHFFGRPRSYYGGTDDEDESDDDSMAEMIPTDEEGTMSAVDSPHPSTSTSDRSSSQARQRRVPIRWEDSMKVMTYWREDYDLVLVIVRPIYIELTEACSEAVQESIKRLRRLQDLDARFQDRPWLYKYYYRWKVGARQEREERRQFAYDPSQDPSVPLSKAIERFQQHRLTGLDRLYTSRGVPRRILFLLLGFQFNLHAYAEQIYTLSSLIFELDRSRTRRRFWMPSTPLRKWFLQGHTMEENYELDTPGAIAEISTSATELQRTLSRQLSTTMRDNLSAEKLPRLYKLNSLQRGEIHTAEEHQLQFHATKPTGCSQLEPETTVVWWCPWRRRPLHGPEGYHDPDVAFPTTATQRFFYSFYLFCIECIYTADAAFAFRAAFVVAFLTLPGFIESSVGWYNEVRGQWAAVVALIWMGPSVGSNFFGTMTRTVGTFIGAVEAMVIWEISQSHPAGLIVLTFVCNLPWWLMYINGKFWKATGLFSLITISLIIGYAYSFEPNGHPISVFSVTWARTVCVLVGVFSALILSIFPFPRTGRVILRHRIAQTLNEIGTLYSSFLALVLNTREEDEIGCEANQKLFRSVALSIRQQIKGERVLLEQSRFEPALRGIFPEDKYLHVLQILDNVLSLLSEMEFSFGKIPLQWRMMIIKDTWKERKLMISSYLTALQLVSNALSNKTPLPPYVVRPTKARRELTNKARKSPAMASKYLGEREYTYFSAYLMNSEQLAVELELLVATVRDLIGPDNVSIWLNYKH